MRSGWHWIEAWSPQVEGPKLRIVRFSGMAMTVGIEKTLIEGVSVRVYGIAKTVADCFKYRNKIGIDVAVEALREVSAKAVPDGCALALRHDLSRRKCDAATLGDADVTRQKFARPWRLSSPTARTGAGSSGAGVSNRKAGRVRLHHDQSAPRSALRVLRDSRW
jgi:hypothetical protein